MTTYRVMYRSGFTIVELLVVIVVIGILAAITTIAYGGVQNTARNTQIIRGVQEYRKIVESYKVINGFYPKTVDEIANSAAIPALSCLGPGYASGCGSSTFKVDSQLVAALKTIGGATIPDIEAASGGPVGSASFWGAIYGNDSITGGNGRTIQYLLRGRNQSCGAPGAISYNPGALVDGTACEIVLEKY